MTATRNTRDLMRDWCSATGYSLPDLIGRGRAVREAGLLTQGALGINAPPAVPADGTALVLSTIVSRTWKDAPKEVRRYGSLPLCGTICHNPITRKDFDADLEDFPHGMPLLHALTKLLEHCGIQREVRFLSLKVDLSEINPAAVLAFGMYEITPTGETHTKDFFLTFLNSKDWTEELIESQVRLNAVALNTMADLLAPNVAAANRARMQAEHENGPPGPTDEPLPSDETPRGANPETTTTHPKARRERDKSQAGLQSYGNSSGGSSLSIRGTTDEKRPRCPG
jgi:hypothetical protein